MSLYLPKNTKRYAYARLVWEGYSYEQAADWLDVTPRTAAQWRYRLTRQAAKATGRTECNYVFALRLLFDEKVSKVLS